MKKNTTVEERSSSPLIRKPITTLTEAMELLTMLHDEHLAYHPEDSALDIASIESGEALFTQEAAEELDRRMEEIHKLNWESLSGPLGRYDGPCGFLLQLDKDYVAAVLKDRASEEEDSFDPRLYEMPAFHATTIPVGAAVCALDDATAVVVDGNELLYPAMFSEDQSEGEFMELMSEHGEPMHFLYEDNASVRVSGYEMWLKDSEGEEHTLTLLAPTRLTGRSLGYAE